MANIDRPSFNAELSSVSEFSSVEKANQFCDFLHTVLDKHAPPSLRKEKQLLSMVWVNKRLTFYSYERKTSSREEMQEHKVSYFHRTCTDVHMVSKLEHTAKC